MKFCINGENLIRLLYLSAKLFKFEIQKCSQILCAHKPYFLMLGHILSYMYVRTYVSTYATQVPLKLKYCHINATVMK